MHIFSTITALLPICAAGRQLPVSRRQATKVPAFFLAGDSTTAVNGGWGDGLIAPLRNGAWGVNVGKGGATTKSFEAGGYWARTTGYVRDNADEYDVYVTLSFGHNDQKPANNVTFAEYQANLIRFANEVKTLGGTPLLTSSLTRRVFSGGQVVDSLANERRATGAAANATDAVLLDLNSASRAYVKAIGKEAATRYNYGADLADTTHLNDRGAVVFGRMVIDLILEHRPALAAYFTPNATISDAIADGRPV